MLSKTNVKSINTMWYNKWEGFIFGTNMLIFSAKGLHIVNRGWYNKNEYIYRASHLNLNNHIYRISFF